MRFEILAVVFFVGEGLIWERVRYVARPFRKLAAAAIAKAVLIGGKVARIPDIVVMEADKRVPSREFGVERDQPLISITRTLSRAHPQKRELLAPQYFLVRCLTVAVAHGPLWVGAKGNTVGTLHEINEPSMCLNTPALAVLQKYCGKIEVPIFFPDDSGESLARPANPTITFFQTEENRIEPGISESIDECPDGFS